MARQRTLWVSLTFWRLLLWTSKRLAFNKIQCVERVNLGKTGAVSVRTTDGRRRSIAVLRRPVSTLPLSTLRRSGSKPKVANRPRLPFVDSDVAHLASDEPAI